jgi:hypothetical protein
VATSGTGCIGLLLGIGSEAVTVPEIAGAARPEVASGDVENRMHAQQFGPGFRQFIPRFRRFGGWAVTPAALLPTLSPLAAYLQHGDMKNGC